VTTGIDHNRPATPNIIFDQGVLVSAPYPPQAGGGQPNNTLGLLAMILGIASIPLACCWLGIPLGVAAIVTGVLGKQKADQGQATNRGQAVAGLYTGIAGAGLTLLLIILVAVLNVTSIPYSTF
jgi:hypothetical protein